MEHLKTGAAVIGVILAIFGLGSTFGRSEVTAVKESLAGHEKAAAAVDGEQTRRIEKLETIGDAAAKVEQAAKDTKKVAEDLKKQFEENMVQPARGGRR